MDLAPGETPGVQIEIEAQGEPLFGFLPQITLYHLFRHDFPPENLIVSIIVSLVFLEESPGHMVNCLEPSLSLGILLVK
jgi:hypothetical protein